MDIKYDISKFKNSKIEEAKDSVSIEEPLIRLGGFKKFRLRRNSLRGVLKISPNLAYM